MSPFVKALPNTPQSDAPALAAAWQAAFAAAQTTWPGVEVPEDALVAAVVARLPSGPPLAGLAKLRLSDLYLVCGCLRGQRDALQAFERTYRSVLAAAARRTGTDQPEEVVQNLLVRLVVGPPPRLQTYAGTGQLKRWLKIACTRLAIDTNRSDNARRDRGEQHGQLAAQLTEHDPELRLLKRKYRQAFRQAFATAMRDLTPKARNILRLHLINQRTIDEIAPIYKVHRATAARWLARARAEVLERSRASLGALLQADDRDVESIMHLIASRLDVSIAHHLASTQQHPD